MMLRRRRALVGDRSGAAAVEFALLLPVLIVLLLMVIEFGAMFLAQGLLESAALRGSRLASTGYSPDGVSREAYIRNYIADQGIGLIRADRLVVEPTAYSDFGDVGVDGKGTAGYGGSGDVVVYSLTYPWTPLVGENFGRLIGRAFGAPLTLRASIAARNEAW